jgi:hypothetical protein
MQNEKKDEAGNPLGIKLGKNCGDFSQIDWLWPLEQRIVKQSLFVHLDNTPSGAQV